MIGGRERDRIGIAVQTNLQHVQQRRLSGVVKTKEKQLRMFVHESKGRENIVDCASK